jgi:hypothetical protein
LQINLRLVAVNTLVGQADKVSGPSSGKDFVPVQATSNAEPTANPTRRNHMRAPSVRRPAVIDQGDEPEHLIIRTASAH